MALAIEIGVTIPEFLPNGHQDGEFFLYFYKPDDSRAYRYIRIHHRECHHVIFRHVKSETDSSLWKAYDDLEQIEHDARETFQLCGADCDIRLCEHCKHRI